MAACLQDELLHLVRQALVWSDRRYLPAILDIPALREGIHFSSHAHLKFQEPRLLWAHVDTERDIGKDNLPALKHKGEQCHVFCGNLVTSAINASLHQPLSSYAWETRWWLESTGARGALGKHERCSGRHMGRGHGSSCQLNVQSPQPCRQHIDPRRHHMHCLRPVVAPCPAGEQKIQTAELQAMTEMQGVPTRSLRTGCSFIKRSATSFF